MKKQKSWYLVVTAKTEVAVAAYDSGDLANCTVKSWGPNYKVIEVVNVVGVVPPKYYRTRKGSLVAVKARKP